jgi:succinylarginine dihydrolase
MTLREINFDGIIGPSHNYSGLSLGNIASATNKGLVSHPRAAALQGLEKMRHNLRLGLAQGVFVPHPRPDRAWLAELGTSIEEVPPSLRVGDVGGERRHGVARARHRRRPLPPDRRQPAHHGAPKP